MHAALPLGWYYLPIALALGALHALEPGHGKSLATAYLAGTEHTRKDALVLGLATTLSHTGVVLLLAGASLWLKAYLRPGQLEQLIRIFGALALIGLGAWTTVKAIRDLSHGHGHSHSHGHDHGKASSASGTWGVFLIGLGNGTLPCPGALAALLVALSLGRPILGMVTVLTYSLGLALALAGMGILVVEASRRARTWLPSEQALLWLPVGSGILVFATGLALLGLRLG